jgi:hypothetical protein
MAASASAEELLPTPASMPSSSMESNCSNLADMLSSILEENIPVSDGMHIFSPSEFELQWICNREINIYRMPFELSVLAEATMDVHSVTVDNDTTVEDIKVPLFLILSPIFVCIILNHLFRPFLRFPHPYPTLSLLCFTMAPFCAMETWPLLEFSLPTCLLCVA